MKTIKAQPLDTQPTDSPLCSITIPKNKLEMLGLVVDIDDKGLHFGMIGINNTIDMSTIYNELVYQLGRQASEEKAHELADVACNAIGTHELKLRLKTLLE